MIIVIGSTTVLAGRMDEALKHSLEHVHRSRAEPGCVSHAVHRDSENANRLVFVEEWEDMAALHTHFKVPASGQFVKTLAGMSEGPPTMKAYDGAFVDPFRR